MVATTTWLLRAVRQFQDDTNVLKLELEISRPSATWPFKERFSNLVGCVYRKGNIIFTSDGNSVVSPVGNRISIFDLKNNKSETLPVESRMNITVLALAPNGKLMIAINEDGEAHLISLVSGSILHTYHFHCQIHAASFSPDGKKFAVTRENTVKVFHAPGSTMQFNPFVLYRSFYGSYDQNVCIDWTTDSKAFCVGSKDMNTRVYGAEKFSNLIVYSVGGHNDCIFVSVSRNGHVNIWQCDTALDGLIPAEVKIEEVKSEDEEEDEEEDEQKEQEKATQDALEVNQKILYKRLAKFNYKSCHDKEAKLTCADYHKKSRILISGFSDGAFFLHEMPGFILIHSLSSNNYDFSSVSNQSLSTVSFNSSGDWISLGCSSLGQLLVWEWQSESYILKQQGHSSLMTCVQYSPDGQYLVTGGDDAKVKVWNTSTGFCFVTFSDHLSGISAVRFTQSGQVIVSASLDGTVRAFDLNRYRNFRTFTSPRPVQFASLAVDGSGEVVCAGGQDTYEIYVWSMQTGRLLEILAGHTAPVSSLAFTPAHPILVSGSWDHTIRLWDVFVSRGSKEVIQLNSDALAVTYRPDGLELAVSTLDGSLTFWDTHSAAQTASIQGRADLGYTRKEGDRITAKKSAQSKAYTSLCYTADGQCILAGGKSKNICIYSVKDQMLLKKFEITCNLSFDGTLEFLDRRKMTEWGNIGLVDEGQGGNIALPGVRKGDLSSRHFRPEVQVTSVAFSPTGRAFAGATTEGLLIYSLDASVVFDPFDLEEDVTPESVRTQLAENQLLTALLLALRLNEDELTREVIEQIPHEEVSFLCQSLPEIYVDKMLHFVASSLDQSAHLGFYVHWSQQLLLQHGPALKQRAHSIMPSLRALQRVLTKRHSDLASICDHNKYLIQFILSLGESRQKRSLEESHDSDEEDLMQTNGAAASDSDELDFSDIEILK
ncbi:hypothetical protein CAPTEDRAFT_223834 [Capitella teleta]|uniref:Small-subunit processome Utp12 domain-containing protein n=1 Tax=Capitella teleta TaxID=283909 RepID=R7UD33_CAPTE|nr:hypothetical protein CAPTEDRAFT_223834 [Capitella teleta]|eukprot:ELU01708.1 hypothetical protein CAPTEDRAFT_223834 [Capitella teleta]